MKVFQDRIDGQHWSFEDDVSISKDIDGVYSFRSFTGALLNTPKTLEPAIDPEPDGALNPVIYVPPVKAAVFIERLINLGLWDQVAAAIHADPAISLKFSTQPGIAADDAQIRAILTDAGANPDAILTP